MEFSLQKNFGKNVPVVFSNTFIIWRKSCHFQFWLLLNILQDWWEALRLYFFSDAGFLRKTLWIMNDEFSIWIFWTTLLISLVFYWRASKKFIVLSWKKFIGWPIPNHCSGGQHFLPWDKISSLFFTVQPFSEHLNWTNILEVHCNYQLQFQNVKNNLLSFRLALAYCDRLKTTF